ncbi:toxin VasX [Aquimarina sp. I32.4]|uniref:toxin VasX n=1 Tax=Aquimarina sp. I32.4 TaxID=2053903 RepID=UPI000CDF13EB|nr:toxin VasX [Aquimarina sp. I32.4]
MERNEALEAYQKEAYNQVVATYTFSVEVAGVTSSERPLLEAKKPGVSLNFLRYGAFNAKPNIHLKQDIQVHAPETSTDIEEDQTTTHEKVKRIELDPVEVTANKKTPQKPNDHLPEIENAYYQRTILNEGYLYLIEDGENQHWLEYEINALGGVHPIFWKNNINDDNTYKDSRDKVAYRAEYSLIFKEGTILWVGYSATQLSISQLEELKGNLGTTDTFLKVECKSFLKTEAENLDYKQQIAPYNRFYAQFDPRLENQSMIFANRLRHIAEIEQAPDPNNENDLLEDLFVTLLDPIGCADDLYYLTEKEHNYHEALIATLTMPQHPRDYYETIWKNSREDSNDNSSENSNDDSKDDSDGISKEIQEQLNYLFITALATYKFVYDNPETIDDYSRDKKSWSHGVDREKIYKILNVREREKQRGRIYKMRDALGTVLKSEHYQNALLGYKNNIPLRQEAGKLHAASHLYMLATYQGIADRDLNLAKDYKPSHDYWLQQIRNTLVPNPTVFKMTTALLDLEIDIDDLENEAKKPIKTHLKFGKKFVSLGKKILGAYAAIGSVSQSEFELVNKKIFFVSTISKKGKKGPFYKFKNKTVDGFLNNSELKKLAKR